MKQSPEESTEWPEPIVVYTQCIICDGFMDSPHCDKAGCPYCAQCVEEKEEEIRNQETYPEGE